jgi:transketolase
MRNAFSEEITKLAGIDKRIVLLSGDIGNRLFDEFKSRYPERFYNCGVAEQNMTGVAAGLSLSGFLPITYTIAPFCTTRCLEQIRTDLAYHCLPSIIVSVGGGLAYAGLGPTHHALEDIAFLRSIPNVRVICPSDPFEVKQSLNEAIKTDGPIYLRLGKKGEPNINSLNYKNFKIGQAYKLVSGKDFCILSSGTILPEVIKAKEALNKKGFFCSVYHFPTVKPLDNIVLKKIALNYKNIITVEEHSTIGGFGSAVSEWFIDNIKIDNSFLRIGTPDNFFKKSGSQNYAREVLGLSGNEMCKRIIKFVS